ncbi:MAG: hypothetical protein GX804_00540, partial [Lentisphaerae bacterium]|nr:hypothetical protein [Lentisphaerota bacterium]
DVIRWISGAKPAMGLFDIVYADPPYASEKQTDGMEEVMKLLIQSETLAPDAIFVAEQGRDSPLTPSTREWIRIIERNYGHSRISIFKRNGGQDECRFHE